MLVNCYQDMIYVLSLTEGGFSVMAETTRTLAAKTRAQLFFVITITASTRCLVENFQLICYSHRLNATSQYDDSGSSIFQNGRTVGRL